MTSSEWNGSSNPVSSGWLRPTGFLSAASIRAIWCARPDQRWAAALTTATLNVLQPATWRLWRNQWSAQVSIKLKSLSLTPCGNWVKFKAPRSNAFWELFPNDHFASYQERIKVIYGRQIASLLSQWMSHKLQQLTVYVHIFSDRKWENYDFNWLLASSCLKILVEAGMYA